MCKVPNEKLNFPEALTDEELCRLVAEGNRQAEEILAARYIRLVRTCARPYFLAGGDSEDLTQEGMLGLIKAVREFNGNKDASFRSAFRGTGEASGAEPVGLTGYSRL